MLDRYSELLTRAITRRAWRSGCRRRQRRGDADRAPARQARPRDRSGADRDQQKGGNAKKLLDAVPTEHAKTPAISSPRCTSAARRQVRRSRESCCPPRAPGSGPRRRGMVGRAADHGAQAARPRRRPFRLSDGGDAAEPTKENSRVERLFMAGWIALRYLDDPADGGDVLRPHPGRQQPYDVAGALALLARPRGGSDAPAGPGARRVQGGGRRVRVLLRAACPRAAGARRARARTAAGNAGQAHRGRAAGARSRAGDPLCAQRAHPGHPADGRHRRLGRRHRHPLRARRTGRAARGCARHAAPRQGRPGTRPAARLLRVSSRRRAALFADRSQHRQRDAVRHHPPGEYVRSGGLVEPPRRWA